MEDQSIQVNLAVNLDADTGGHNGLLPMLRILPWL